MSRPRDVVRGRWASPLALVAVALGLLALPACKRKHIPATSVEELGYPRCPPGSGEPKPPVLLASGDLRSGANDVRSTIVERFRIEQRDCHVVATVRQEWPHQIADVEAIFDRDGLPIRVWRRWTNPLSKRPDGNADLKRFDFRTPVISAKHRADTGVIDFEHIHGPRPKALIGSGHGLLTLWIQRAKLEVGQKVREPAFDFRGVEVAKEVTLMRHPDKDEPTLGR